jgi:hypothetical protein
MPVGNEAYLVDAPDFYGEGTALEFVRLGKLGEWN